MGGILHFPVFLQVSQGRVVRLNLEEVGQLTVATKANPAHNVFYSVTKYGLSGEELFVFTQ